MTSEDLLPIGELARRVGLRPSALRYYEDAGLMRPATRIAGRRRYGPSAVRRLNVIHLLREAGFGIREVRALLRTGTKPSAWRPFAEQKLREIDAQIAEAHQTRRLIERALACSCESLEGCNAIQERLGSHQGGRLIQIAPRGSHRRPGQVTASNGRRLQP